MPMMLQQTPRNFKGFQSIEFSEGTTGNTSANSVHSESPTDWLGCVADMS
jgi:hypothetical protein